MLSLTLNVGSLAALIRGLASVTPRVKAMEAAAINAGGEKLYNLLVSHLGNRYGVSPTRLDVAMDFIPATEGHTTYTVSANNDDLPYRRWFTQQDEKVCKICGPRHGRIFALEDTYKLYPAHPNCRCRLVKLDFGNAFADLPPAILEEAAEVAVAHFLYAFQDACNAIDRRV